MIVEAINIGKNVVDGDLEVAILKNINFSVDEGEFVAFLGPMGSGKSTIIKIIGLLTGPSLGHLNVLGQDVTAFNDQQRIQSRKGKIGYLFNEPFLVDSMTISDNIALPLNYLKRKKSEVIDRVNQQLEHFGLIHKAQKYPSDIPFFQQQLVSLARALVVEPVLFLADEPAARLSTTQCTELMDHICNLQNSEITIVLATQSKLLTGCATRVINVIDGHVGSEINNQVK